MLMVEASQFVDWQRIRMQENPDTIPPGALPRSLDIIVRNEAVEQTKAGDRCFVTGNVIVVPDVSQLMSSGAKTSSHSSIAGRALEGYDGGGIRGLKQLGTRDLGYKLTFLGNKIELPNEKVYFQLKKKEHARADHKSVLV